MMIKFFFVLLIFVVLAICSTSCLQFRKSKREAQHYFQELKKSPTTISLTVENKNLQGYYLDQNAEITIVFIHGTPGSASNFFSFFKDTILLSTYNIFMVDRPGFGYSDFGKPVPSLSDQSFFINQLIQALPKRKFVLVGHSLGAPIAAKIAMEYKETVAALFLIGASIDPELEKLFWYNHMVNNNLAKWFMPRSMWVTNKELIPLKEELMGMKPFWKDLTIPIYIFQGIDDSLVPKENVDFALKNIQSSFLEVELVPNENHFTPFTNPAWIADRIHYFIKKQSLK